MNAKRLFAFLSLPKVLALSLGLGAVYATSTEAASVTLSTNTPTVGAGVQNLTFATSTADATAVQFIDTDYIAGDATDNGGGSRVAMGQTFTTGGGMLGYTLSAISIHQVGAFNTYYDYTGGNLSIQVFRLGANTSAGVYSITPLVTETVAVGGAAGGFNGPATLGANAQWLTFTLSSTLPLAANTQYGFQITSDGTGGNDGLFLETDGTNTNPYAGGFALGTALVNGSFDTANVFDGANGQPSDRAFVATMTAVVPEPSAFVLAGLGGTALAVLRRRNKK